MRYATDVQHLVAMRLVEDFDCLDRDAWRAIDAATVELRASIGSRYTGLDLYDRAADIWLDLYGSRADYL